MFKHALVVVGRGAGSERCFPWLRRLMDGSNARIRLLTILDPVRAPVIVGNAVVAYVDQQEDAQRLEACAALGTSATRLQELGFEVSVDVRFGDPVVSTLDVAETSDIDVIALAVAPAELTPPWWRRTAVERLFETAKVPIFVVRQRGQRAA